jgi:exosortase/archaeosortase family protein
MKKFILLYWFNIAILFSIFYFDISPVADIVNSIQTDFTSYLTSLTLPSNQMVGNRILIDFNYSLIIEKDCNGLIAYLFFLASIFAFPSTTIHKFKWAIYGYIAIISINIFRIWLITKLVLYEKDNFSLAHDFIGNTLLIFTALVLFIVFIKTREETIKY